MFRLELPTLFMTSALVMIITLAPIGLLVRISRGDLAAWRWLQGAAALTLALALFSLREWLRLPDLLGVVVANMSFAMGSALIVVGVLGHLRAARPARMVASATTLSALALCAFTFVWPSLQLRIQLSSLIVAAVYGFGAWALLRLPARTLPARFVTGLFALLTLAFTLRVVMTPFRELQPVFSANGSWLHGGVAALHLGVYVALVSAMGLLVAERLSEERAKEREARDTEARRLQEVMDGTPGVVWEADAQTFNFTFVSRQCEAITGFTAEEWLQPGFWLSRLHPEDRAEAAAYCMDRTQELEDHVFDYRFIAKDGAVLWMHDRVGVVAEGGRPRWVRGVMLDITERKRLEQEVDARNRELARVQALAAMGRMASMLAHDLANPLSSVKMAVQILGRRATDQEAGELAAIGLEQVQYMERIIAEMLTYARPGELEIGWLDAARLLTGVIGTVQRRIDEYGVAVDVDCPPGLPSFPGDASKLRQLFSNLLVNALQAVAVRPAAQRRVTIHVDLATLADGRALRFRVCDNGAGIEPEVRERLFEPFFTTRAKGTGLGLAIVRQITDLHHAAIALTDNEPVGTCAVLVLPLTPAVPEGEAAAVASRREET